MIDNREKYLRIWDRLVRCIYPKHCPVCDEIIPINEDYCSCINAESVKISNNFCRHCGQDIYKCVCAAENSIPLPEVAGVYFYGGKIRADILDLKFNNRKRLAVSLGAAMAERCANVYCNTDFDIVTFVPMTKKSLDKRMYNQSRLLANQVGRMMLVPVEDLFVKTRDTHSQFGLGGKDRVQNVVDSVILQEDVSVKGKNILICDDVKTTGATLNQCVAALEKAGAGKICCICAAITDFSQ